MLYYLDTNIIIYAVEGQPPFQLRARNHIAALEAAGHCFVVGDLTWTECLVFPYRNRDGQMMLDYQQFFLGPHITTVSPKAAISQRAALIRGTYRFGLADSVHLATAVEHRLDRFLTNDNRLAAFTDITVEILP
jgi:uncharacterized protein